MKMGSQAQAFKFLNEFLLKENFSYCSYKFWNMARIMFPDITSSVGDGHRQ